MTLILREDYHALPIVEQNRLRWIPPERAERQDIRPLRIGILNIMPLGEQYEFNILNPLGLSEDGVIDWSRGAAAISCRIRGVTPWPGARCGWWCSTGCARTCASTRPKACRTF